MEARRSMKVVLPCGTDRRQPSPEWNNFELFRVMRLVPQGFHDQTNQRIRSGIRR
jgi:hypothetical protein